MVIMATMTVFWFLLVSAAPLNAGQAPVIAQPPAFRAFGGATAHATASIRIISGASYGPGRAGKAPGAVVRTTQLADAQGSLHPANLLEFQ